MARVNYFPAFLDLRGKSVIVAGGGRVAYQKIQKLLRAGASVTVVSPTVDPVIARWISKGRIRWRRRRFQERDLKGAWLIITATDDSTTGRQARRWADRRSIWTNVADTPDACSMIMPAVMRRRSLAVAYSTGANSPALAAALRKQLERQIPPAFGRWSDFLGALRPRLKKTLSPLRRKRLFKALVSEKFLNQLACGNFQPALRQAQQLIDTAQESTS